MLWSSLGAFERLERLSLRVGERRDREVLKASPLEFTFLIGVEKCVESSPNLRLKLGGVRVVSLLVFTSTLVG